MRFVVSLLVVLSVVSAIPAGDAPATRPATLKEAAAGRFLIGTTIDPRKLVDKPYANIVSTHFNCITTENQMKAQWVCRNDGTFRFTESDAAIDFAREHDMKVISHCLIWYRSMPKWFYKDAEGNDASRELMLERMQTFINASMKHWKGRVIGYDAVNEVLSDDENEELRQCNFVRLVGEDFIEKAFEMAHAADPNAELYYNDYDVWKPHKRDKVVRLIRRLKGKGLRIDAVGMQGHWSLWRPSVEEVEQAIIAFHNEGVKVMITELDIDVLPGRDLLPDIDKDILTLRPELNPYKEGAPPEVLAEQAQRYADLFALFLKHQDKISRVTLWGVCDRHTWLHNWPIRGRVNYPLLFDHDYQPKPAFHAVLDTLNSAPSGQDLPASQE